jgi:glutamate carboxypeptidase
MNAGELLAGIRRWVEIESHTADPDGLGRILADAEALYRAAGFATERAPGAPGGAGHLIARSPWGSGPGILILSHLDTVHPKGVLARLPFRIEGDNAYGPGIYDMKGGAYLACRAATEGPVPLPVTHLLTSDEEIGSPSSRDLILRLAEAARVVLVTEPAREGGRIVTARKGVARWDIRAHGRPAHAGAQHEKGRSAIVEIARQVLRLSAMTDYARGITVNVGLISGGTGANVVPEEAWIRVDCRIPTVEAAEEMQARMAALAPVDAEVRLEVTGGLDRPPYEKSAEIAALFEHAKGLAAEIGWELRDVATGGGSDGNFTAPIRPTLDGLGVDGDGAHTLGERLYIGSLVPRQRLMRRLLETLH